MSTQKPDLYLIGKILVKRLKRRGRSRNQKRHTPITYFSSIILLQVRASYATLKVRASYASLEENSPIKPRLPPRNVTSVFKILASHTGP